MIFVLASDKELLHALENRINSTEIKLAELNEDLNGEETGRFIL